MAAGLLIVLHKKFNRLKHFFKRRHTGIHWDTSVAHISANAQNNWGLIIELDHAGNLFLLLKAWRIIHVQSGVHLEVCVGGPGGVNFDGKIFHIYIIWHFDKREELLILERNIHSNKHLKWSFFLKGP